MKHKLKVLHIINSHAYSGAENVIITIMENMRAGVESYYVSPVGSIQDVLKKKNLSYIPIKSNNLSVSNIKSVIKQYKPDVIHAHDFRAGIFSRMTFTGIPIINHLHNNSPWLKNYSIYTLLYAFCCYRFNKILTVSSSVMDEFVFGSKFKFKTQVIGNPFDAEKIRNRASTADINELSDLIFLGRLTPQKNIFLFLDIVKRLTRAFPSIKIAVVGDGELHEAFTDKIDELGLKQNIKLYGFQINPYGLIKNSKVLCMPSKWEGFGLAAAEALSLGIPVVCSGVGGLKNIVDDSCGSICGFEIENYVAEISKLLLEKEYRDMKAKSALKKSELLSNIDKYINMIEDIYKTIQLNKY
ncbi:glycosyltransferase [Megasphaera sp.]|uniref:glycosyltransferase n=1 Tax=Megasphaera sp. TaxID=2023260 RepID=UPI0025899AA6|nr:glycosyltransferase [Megasphaera sp.]